ncbi:nuclear transport factor 2 family protein [Rhodococcus sp. NPDC059234]|uniref:nuclear transport factor 2 family protein n=1 Tax=Rhodococcus sp. NPDC059234 TaxID=3346781 RepID=UPI00367182F0
MTESHGSTGSPADTRSTVELLRTTERSRLRALVAADIDTARAMHGHDFQLITPVGAALTRDEYLGAVAGGQIDYLLWEPDEIEVRLLADAAIIRYRATLEVVFGSYHVPRTRFWHTDSYELRDRRWQAIWSQATEIRAVP